MNQSDQLKQKMENKIHLFGLIWLLNHYAVFAYPYGAPENVCYSMQPSVVFHREPMKRESDYIISFVSTTTNMMAHYGNGENIDGKRWIS